MNAYFTKETYVVREGALFTSYIYIIYMLYLYKVGHATTILYDNNDSPVAFY